MNATGQICQTGTALAQAGHFRQSRPPQSAQDCNNLDMLLKIVFVHRWAKFGAPGEPAKLGPTQTNFADSMRHAKMTRICCQSSIRNLHAATAKSVTAFRVAAAARNLNTAIPLQSSDPMNSAQRVHKLLLQNPISTPKRKIDDFETLFQPNFQRKISSAKMEKISCQSTIHNLHAATAIRFTTFSCKKQEYTYRSCRSEEP